MESFKKIFEDSINLKKEILTSGNLNVLKEMGDEIVSSIKSGSKILLCGNGGSAADAQHLAAEMLVRLKPQNNRAAIPAIALAQDTSTITACGNDFGYTRLKECCKDLAILAIYLLHYQHQALKMFYEQSRKPKL